MGYIRRNASITLFTHPKLNMKNIYEEHVCPVKITWRNGSKNRVTAESHKFPFLGKEKRLLYHPHQMTCVCQNHIQGLWGHLLACLYVLKMIC